MRPKNLYVCKKNKLMRLMLRGSHHRPHRDLPLDPVRSLLMIVLLAGVISALVAGCNGNGSAAGEQAVMAESTR